MSVFQLSLRPMKLRLQKLWSSSQNWPTTCHNSLEMPKSVAMHEIYGWLNIQLVGSNTNATICL